MRHLSVVFTVVFSLWSLETKYYTSASGEIRKVGIFRDRFDIYDVLLNKLKKRILVVVKDYESLHNDAKRKEADDAKRLIFEKYLQPSANGTSLLKDFYPGRY